jgi:hypothetical protein
VTGTWVWVNTCPNPPSRWLKSTLCPAGPLVTGFAVANLTGSRPDGDEVALASQSKKVLSFESSSLMAVMDESTFGLHSVKDLSSAAADSYRLVTHVSQMWSSTATSSRCLEKAASWLVNPSFISARSFVSSSRTSLMLGSMAPNFVFWRWV